MKRTLSIFLIILVLLSLTGCGNEKHNESKEKKFTFEEAIGIYKNVGLLMNEDITYELRNDNTFDQIAKIPSLSFKGTFSTTEDGRLILSKNKSSTREIFNKYGEYFYATEGGITYFDTDEEYGKKITFDENKKTNQTFITFHHDINRDSSGSALYYTFGIQFSIDGTFKLYKYYRTPYSSGTNNEEFEGTYSVNKDIVTLNYDGINHILLIIDDKLYFDVIQKQ